MDINRETRRNRRQFPRLVKDVHVGVRRMTPSDEGAIEAETRNVSVGGVAVWVTGEMVKGTPVKLNISGVKERGVIQVKGRVAWTLYNNRHKVYETGIELVGLRPETLERLLLLISERGLKYGSIREKTHFMLDDPVGLTYRRAGSTSERDWTAGTTRELSLREVVLQVKELLTRGPELDVRLDLPGRGKCGVTCRGEVCEVNQAGRINEWDATVMVREISAEERMRLAAFLSSHIMA